MGLLSTTAAAVNAAGKLLFGNNTNGDIFAAHVPVDSTGTEKGTTANPFLVVERPYQGVVPIVVGTAQAAQRALRVAASVAGNVSVNYSDGSTDVIPVGVGLSIIPGAFTGVNSSGTTATATYANLK